MIFKNAIRTNKCTKSFSESNGRHPKRTKMENMSCLHGRHYNILKLD